MTKNTNPSKAGRWTTFSYADANDPWWKKALINGVELSTGRRTIERLYNEIRDLDVPGHELWGLGLEQLRIEIDYDSELLAKLPADGPLIFIANHPYGVVDGLVLAALLAKVRDRFVFLVNEVLTRDERLKPFLLPIDFRETEEALKINLESRRLAIERLKSGGSLAIFPAGGVMTAKSYFGPAEDLEWKRFVLKLIQQSKATVVPLYIEGQNSRLFQMVSQFSMALRLGMLLYETVNKQGRSIKVNIGAAISFEELQVACDPKKQLDYLRDRVMELKKAENQ
jgi:putative hemolysin